MPQMLFPDSRFRHPTAAHTKRDFTVGVISGSPLMLEGKAGMFPSNTRGGVIRSLYLLGEQTGEAWYPDHDLSHGQGPSERPSQMPQICIRVSNKPFFFAIELLKAHSAPHGDHSLVEKLSAGVQELLKGQALTESVEFEKDTFVVMLDAIQKLRTWPLVGYKLHAPLLFGRDDYIQVLGIPPGMRLYMTGIIGEELGK